MIDPLTIRRWGYRTGFVALSGLIVFVHVLPFRLGASGLPGPDVLVLLTFAWVLRRPEYVPVWLIAPVMLAADLLLVRPPGLWAALTVLASEFLRSRGHLSAELPFPVEWLLVSGMLVAMGAANGVVLALAMVPLPGFGQLALQVVASVLAYPVLVAGSAWLLGVRPPVPGAADAGGQRP
ncbi:membrane protein [Oceaniovalibus guishaninsula JLT2003]|uniref:Membrane protein n=1 Tax=Oceaniovalibus guishaninsula JLT2003 TaxID=1231392 RepID=K2H8H4_9RHOB|nr:hypothetical protein [Oceaniovalibus guishaninsula]EKE43893.1 membrane protein [Oceaniovalibus guishaninsula JLT2003]